MQSLLPAIAINLNEKVNGIERATGMLRPSQSATIPHTADKEVMSLSSERRT
jgi:hypothetical protein